MRRRNWLIGAGVSLMGAGYVLQRGVRFPRLTLSPHQPADGLTSVAGSLQFEGLISTPAKQSDEQTLNLSDLKQRPAAIQFRAYVPEPTVNVKLNDGGIVLQISNIMPSAQLKVESSSLVNVSENVANTHREIRINGQANAQVSLHYELAHNREYQFAVIGDSGGGDELTWCIERATALNADFLLHLGDFNYGGNEYTRAIEAFKSSAIPCYVTLGNHDFNDSGLVYDRFLNEVGPFNSSFYLAGNQFINVDTAASFLPLKGGHRGPFLSNLSANSLPKIVFSHRPFVDIRPGEDHTLSSEREAQWLMSEFKRLGCTDYLCGHVHKSGSSELDGLRQWTAGEGLGYEDLVARNPVSKMLMGHIAPQEQPTFEWVDLIMPWQMHTSQEHLDKLKKEQPRAALDWYLKTLSQTNLI